MWNAKKLSEYNRYISLKNGLIFICANQDEQPILIFEEIQLVSDIIEFSKNTIDRNNVFSIQTHDTNQDMIFIKNGKISNLEQKNKTLSEYFAGKEFKLMRISKNIFPAGHSFSIDENF